MQTVVDVGIDEAGRGPVLGPMVYGAAYWEQENAAVMEGEGYDDSKVLSIEKREELYERIVHDKRMGWVVKVISAKEISNKMLSQTRNLNQMSRDAVIEMIDEILNRGVQIGHVYVDTVGDPGWYEQFLTKHYKHQLRFTVAKKADSLYKVVSAASICAKVTRDTMMANWEFEETLLKANANFGSGYPSDPRTKEWLAGNIEPVFGFPRIVRFSWGTLEGYAHTLKEIQWHRQDDQQDAPSILGFFPKKSQAPKGTRSAYFEQAKIHHVQSF